MANPYEAKFNVEAPAGRAGEGASAKEPISGIGNASGANVTPKESTTDDDAGHTENPDFSGGTGGYGVSMPAGASGATGDRCVTAESLDSIRGWKPPHRR